MTVSTLRPNGTTSNTGALTGGASAHAVLSDNSDSSYITFDPGEACTVALGDLSLPAGAVIKQYAVRLRLRGLSDVVHVSVADLATSLAFNVTTPTTFTVGTQAGGTDSEIDAASLVITNPGGSPFELHEAYLDVTHVAEPVAGVGLPTGTVKLVVGPTGTFNVMVGPAGGEYDPRERDEPEPEEFEYSEAEANEDA